MNHYLLILIRNHNTPSQNKLNLPIISSARHTNENLTIEILKMIKTKLNKRITKILVCGVAFKGLPTTSDIRGSLATEVIKQTKKLFYNPRIDVLDKYVSEEDAKKINNDSKFFKNFESINEKYNFILILNNSHYWKDVGYKKFSNKLFNKGIIYDFWSSFKKDKYKKNYFRFGGGDLFLNPFRESNRDLKEDGVLLDNSIEYYNLCIVQNPYQRAVSLYKNGMQLRKEHDLKSQNFSTYFENNLNKWGDPVNDDNFTSQHDYIKSYDDIDIFKYEELLKSWHTINEYLVDIAIQSLSSDEIEGLSSKYNNLPISIVLNSSPEVLVHLFTKE